MRRILDENEVLNAISRTTAYNTAADQQIRYLGQNPTAEQLADIFKKFVKPVVDEIPNITIGSDKKSQYLGNIMIAAEKKFWNLVVQYGLVKEVEEILHLKLFS